MREYKLYKHSVKNKQTNKTFAWSSNSWFGCMVIWRLGASIGKIGAMGNTVGILAHFYWTKKKETMNVTATATATNEKQTNKL